MKLFTCTLVTLLLSAITMTSYAGLSKKGEHSSSKNWVPKYKNSKVKNVKLKSKLKTNFKKTKIIPSTPLEALYLKKPKSKAYLNVLKTESLRMAQKAVPTLIKVMKSKKYPSENRWVATYMLGRIMGKKSAPYISKFTKHPNWMLRLASLKVLLHLNQKQYSGIYARLLDDSSLIVRHQALQNIKAMKLIKLAPYVWKMLYNKKNYAGMKGKRKRNNIIKDAIKVVGDLGFKQARKPMLEMFQNKKYSDVYEELDYSLSKISGKISPKGSIALKKHFWKNAATSELTIL